MTRLKPFLLYLFILSLFLSCTKTMDTDDPDVPPIESPGNPGKPNGSLFINIVGYFIQLNTVDSSVVWGTETRNLFSSFDNPITLDSTSFYHGNYLGLTAYSSQTGIAKWGLTWYAFSDAITFRKPAFTADKVFVTSPSSMWDHGYLYCLDKSTGSTKWSVQLDYGYASYPFNTSPMVLDDKVIVMTRDKENHKRLTAFKTSDGSQAWTSEINDNLSFHLRLENGKIYSTSNKYASCHSASNGQLNWQTDLQVNDFKFSSSFIENDKLIVVKVKGTDYTILTLNNLTGAISKRSTLTIPTLVGDPDFSPMGCDYSNNKIFVVTRYNMDSIRVMGYELSTMTKKWEKQIANYLYTGFTPVLTDKYLIFPVNDSYPNGKSMMHFYDLNGNFVTGIPFNANYTSGFVYKEKGVIYKQDNSYLEY